MPLGVDTTQIMSGVRVDKCIKRLAHQIIEDASDTLHIDLLALEPSGVELAKAIKIEIDKSFGGTCSLHSVKKTSLNSINFSLQDYLVIVDDVMFSGRTMLRLVRELEIASTQTVRTLALVDRGHRKVPLNADFVGFVCPTKLDEHVEVEYSEMDKSFSVLLQIEH